MRWWGFLPRILFFIVKSCHVLCLISSHQYSNTFTWSSLTIKYIWQLHLWGWRGGVPREPVRLWFGGSSGLQAPHRRWRSAGFLPAADREGWFFNCSAFPEEFREPSSACFVLFQVKELLATDDFKPNSAMVVLDFLIRHSFIEPDTGL